MIAHAMADMTNTICGHDRDVLSFALGLVHMSSLYAQNDPEVLAYRATRDPAKLAEMLAARGRELGWAVYNEDPGDDLRLPCLLMVLDYDRIEHGVDGPVITIEAFETWNECNSEPHEQEFTLPQARAILLQWIQLPDDAREEALQVLCGNHVDPDELLNTIPVYERVEPRRFDPDPDRGRE